MCLSLFLPPSPSLYFQFGFFRRKKHEELKQRREELQNLQDNGVSPADGAGF
jgi:hypothetical protein